MTNPNLIAKGVSFGFVGSIGFLTDAGVLWFLTEQLGLDPYSGRLLSFSIALFVTWLLNSRFTFRATASRNKRQFLAYVAVQVSSFALNYGIYSLIVWNAFTSPVEALAVASIIAMFYSFTAMNLWVFRDRRQ
ncbi:MAG: GtrA family protein [Pseudomonadota bacterium]|nr:GtrA family protein [Pseudomonadota bacterium]